MKLFDKKCPNCCVKDNKCESTNQTSRQLLVNICSWALEFDALKRYDFQSESTIKSEFRIK